VRPDPAHVTRRLRPASNAAAHRITLGHSAMAKPSPGRVGSSPLQTCPPEPGLHDEPRSQHRPRQERRWLGRARDALGRGDAPCRSAFSGSRLPADAAPPSR
jgi:hypothetical protein